MMMGDGNMFKLSNVEDMTREQRYKLMINFVTSQISSENDILANLSNISAIIYVMIDDINWSGFYLKRGDELVLGPFQGKPACNRIKIGNGVCGTAAKLRRIQIVKNVQEFPGHIACDCESKSEIVIPIIKNDELYGVLDIDSPILNRFSDLEEKYLVKLVDKLVEYMK